LGLARESRGGAGAGSVAKVAQGGSLSIGVGFFWTEVGIVVLHCRFCGVGGVEGVSVL
jgi:hypothetical protein